MAKTYMLARKLGVWFHTQMFPRLNGMILFLAVCTLVEAANVSTIQFRASVAKLEKAEKWDEVISVLSSADADEWNLRHLGNAYLMKRDYVSAEKFYQQVVSMDKKNVYGHLGLADIYIANERWERAKESIETALSINPNPQDLVGIYGNYGYALYQLKHYEDAAAIFEKAMSHPLSEQVYVKLFINAAFNEEKRGNPQKVEKIYNRAIELFPNDYWCWENLGVLYESQQHQDKALACYQKACSLAFKDATPKHQTVFSLPFRGKWFVTQGNGGDSTHAKITNRFAWDFVVRETDSQSLGDGSENKDYFSFEKEILAPADGEVVFVQDDQFDEKPSLSELVERSGGNRIILRHLPGEFTELLHLRQNSAKVKIGDHVRRGDCIALCGNSGSHTSHLHFSLVSDYLPNEKLSLPSQFSNYRCTKHGKSTIVKSGVPGERDEVENVSEKLLP